MLLNNIHDATSPFPTFGSGVDFSLSDIAALWALIFHCAKFSPEEIVPAFYEFHSQFLSYFLLGIWRYSNLLRHFDISSFLLALLVVVFLQSKPFNMFLKSEQFLIFPLLLGFLFLKPSHRDRHRCP